MTHSNSYLIFKILEEKLGKKDAENLIEEYNQELFEDYKNMIDTLEEQNIDITKLPKNDIIDECTKNIPDGVIYGRRSIVALMHACYNISQMECQQNKTITKQLKPLHIAADSILERYIDILQNTKNIEKTIEHADLFKKNLIKIIQENCPLDQKFKSIGFIQGYLVAKNITTLSKENEIIDPIFLNAHRDIQTDILYP